MVGGRNMAEVPCAGTGEKSIEKGDAAVIFSPSWEALTWPSKSPTTRPTTPSRPEDFPAMLEVPRYGRRTRCLRRHHFGHPRPFLGPARQELHRLRPAVRHGQRRRSCPLDMVVELKSAVADRLDDRPEDRARQRRHALVDLQPAAWRAGRAVAVGQPVPHPARSRAPRNTPPTRRARRRATSPASPATSPSAGATRCRSARPSPPC